MKVLYHLGLGDAIACAAIIAKLAKENDVVEIPCWEHNLVSVKSFYVNHPNVIIKCFDAKKLGNCVLEWGWDAELKLGFYNNLHDQRVGEDFVQWFYRQAGMDISEKDRYCPIEKAANLGKMFITMANIIYHDDEDSGFIIPKKKRNSISLYRGDFSLLTMHDAIKNAKEIHCIDSSVLHLVECLPTNAKLFYHKYARPNSTDYKYLQKKWEVIE